MGRSKRSKKTSPSNNEPLFPKFTKLPFEIGSMIGKYTSPGPKIVTIGCKTVKNKDGTESKQLTVSYPIPPFLHMNAGCRAMAKRLYAYAFEKNLGDKRGVYFDWARDALVFENLSAATEFYRLAWASPIPDEHMAMLVSVGIPLDNRPLVLGFSQYRDWEYSEGSRCQLQFTPKAMEMLGEPQHIVLTRRGGKPTWIDRYYTRGAERMWTDALADVDSLSVGPKKDYQFPDITSLTFIQLQAKLIDLDDPTLALKKKERQLARELKKEMEEEEAAKKFRQGDRRSARLQAEEIEEIEESSS